MSSPTFLIIFFPSLEKKDDRAGSPATSMTTNDLYIKQPERRFVDSKKICYCCCNTFKLSSAWRIVRTSERITASSLSPDPSLWLIAQAS